MYLYIGYYAQGEDIIDELSTSIYSCKFKAITEDKIFVGEILSCKKLKNDKLLEKLDNYNLYQQASNLLYSVNKNLWKFANNRDIPLIIYKSKYKLCKVVTADYYSGKIAISQKMANFLNINKNSKFKMQYLNEVCGAAQ